MSQSRSGLREGKELCLTAGLRADGASRGAWLPWHLAVLDFLCDIIFMGQKAPCTLILPRNHSSSAIHELI